jgi:hypothetical protein
MFEAKYENVEITFYSPETEELYYTVSSRLKYITNGDYNRYRKDPSGQRVTKLGLELVTIDSKVIDESYTKIESDIKMLNYMSERSDRNWANSKSIKQALARLAKAGITPEFHNETLNVSLEYIVDEVR